MRWRRSFKYYNFRQIAQHKRVPLKILPVILSTRKQDYLWSCCYVVCGYICYNTWNKPLRIVVV